MTTAMPYRIDMHSHMLPPSYTRACQEHGHDPPDGMPYLPEWSPDAHLELMDKHNIQKSILSISSPGTHLVPGDGELAAKVTRECNEYAADLKKRMPGRFGYFASLPVPEVDICLREIELASKEGCDGFVMMTNGHGTYPGDKVLDPIFDELNRRQATVFFHPTTPTCPCSPEAMANGEKPVQVAPFAGHYPNPFFEFLFDTARTVIHLFLSGTVQRCPKIQFMFSHCGGTLPPLLSRFAVFSSMIPGPWTPIPEEEVLDLFKKQFWFDLAGLPFPGSLQGLLAAGGQRDKLLYGR